MSVFPLVVITILGSVVGWKEEVIAEQNERRR
jgi:hypothetical protein